MATSPYEDLIDMINANVLFIMEKLEIEETPNNKLTLLREMRADLLHWDQSRFFDEWIKAMDYEIAQVQKKIDASSL